MAANASTNLVFVGTYTRLGRSTGIHVFRRDPRSGRLGALQATVDVDPSFLAFSPSREFLFAVGETKEFQGQNGGSVSSWRIDWQTGTLAFISRQPTLGGDPCHLTTDPSGKTLLVANHEDGNIAVLPITSDGHLEPPRQLVQHHGSGPGPTQKGPHAHFVTFDPGARRVLAVDKGIDRIMIYQLDPEAGTLSPADPPFTAVHTGAAPRHLAFHPSGRYAYVNGEADLTITAFRYDGASGRFEELHHLPTVPTQNRPERQSTAQILVHPNGRFVYVSNRGHDSIAIFAIDESSGRLTPAGHVATQGHTPRNFAFDPEARFLYAANQNSHTIVQFSVNADTGNLTPTGNVAEVGGPVCILFG
ncbi:MAG: lactonase family protein [Chloroflexota bacterium]